MSTSLTVLLTGPLLPAEPDCPQGARIYGASLPAGSERYCGKPLPDGRILRHGWYTAWFGNGRKATEGEYQDGLRVSTWSRWWERGGKFEDLTFRDGKLEGPYQSWFRSGKTSATGEYRADWQDGHWVFWHETGTKAADGNYGNGLQQGRWSYWLPDGQFAGRGDVRDGLMLAASADLGESNSMPLEVPAWRERPNHMEDAQGPAAPVLDVAVDSRIELLSAVLGMTLWPELGPWTAGDTAYATDMRRTFETLRDHAAVKQLDQLVRDGFTFEVPFRWIMHYGPPPALEPRIPLDAYVRRRAGGEKVLADLAAALRSFAKDARFQVFLAKHRSYYGRLAASYHGAMPAAAAVPASLEQFYGVRKARYQVAIAPMLGDRSYSFVLGAPVLGAPVVGSPVSGALGTSHVEEVYSVGAPDRQHDGTFAFEAERIRTTLYRDFSHAFTDSAIHAAFGAGYRSDLYPLAKPDMDDLGYVTWRWALSELAVRACEIRLLQRDGYAAEARELLRVGTSVERFAWLPYAVERLAAYEARRDRYPEFGSFAARFLGILDDTAPVPIAGRLMFLLRK